MADYKLRLPSGVIRTADGASIPDDPKNRDWRIYQAWLRAGNTPDPADPLPVRIDADAELATQLAAANTVAQLRDALLGKGTRKAQVVARQK